MTGGRAIAGTDACQCDSGPPPPTANAAGLTQIAYRVADFAGFRRALLTPLTGEQQLASWSPGTGDLGLQALEWWAYLGRHPHLLQRADRQRQLPADGRGPARPAAERRRRWPGCSATCQHPPSPLPASSPRSGMPRGPDGQLMIPADMQITSTPTADAPAQLFEVAVTQEFTGPSDALIGLPPDPALFQPGAQESVRKRRYAQYRSAGGACYRPAGEQLIIVDRGLERHDRRLGGGDCRSAATEKDPNGPGEHPAGAGLCRLARACRQPGGRRVPVAAPRPRPRCCGPCLSTPAPTPTPTTAGRRSGARRRRALPYAADADRASGDAGPQRGPRGQRAVHRVGRHTARAAVPYGNHENHSARSRT